MNANDKQPIENDKTLNAEQERLSQDAERTQNWKRWGPYLAERQWGTVREDYSADNDSWRHLPHANAHQQAYRWGEDGLLGITDRQSRICFALALWNGKDPILKERLFGLTGPQGNHGEDVKESYFYLDSTPTHSYMKALYKYPQGEYPYEKLVTENANRSKTEREYELVDTGAFDEDRYFDVQAEYAKGSPNDILIRLTITNCGPDPAPLHCLPTFWCRNTWAHGRTGEGYWPRPKLERKSTGHVSADHASLGKFHFLVDDQPDGNSPPLLFTDNETNFEKLYGVPNEHPYVKDAFHEYVIKQNYSAVHPGATGTKSAALFELELEAGESVTLKLRICSDEDFQKIGADKSNRFGDQFDSIFKDRINEANEFYEQVLAPVDEGDSRVIARQGYAGLLWTKQFYFYSVRDWLRGSTPRTFPGPKFRLAALIQSRCDFNAGQVGIPMVRRLGFGVPHDSVRCR